ncbi:hypothetical protein ACFU8Q_11220 [Streptomyces sp. NPDC057543]|uniref:hypothetical protein n=1 Tax=Streptomyces sp. NPDC057543 TaxID=3346163 RepID=UPI0036CAE641
MRKTRKLAVVMLAAVGMIGASASMAAADGDITVTGSNCKFAQGDVIVLYQGGCSAVSGGGSLGPVTVSDGSERNATLKADGTKPDGTKPDDSSAAAAAAAASAASSDGSSAAAAASAASASSDGSSAAAAAAAASAASGS